MNNSIHLLQTRTPIQTQSNIITTAGGKVIAIDGGHRADACYFIDYFKTEALMCAFSRLFGFAVG